MTETERPLRADARRNRERILAAAGELFARRGEDAQMDEIAARSGLGMGTLYRHFPSKQALLTAIVGERFAEMAELARGAEEIDDPRAAFDELLRIYLEAAARDAAFQRALLGPDELEWEGIGGGKQAFAELAERILARAVAAGAVRGDLTFADFVLITRGVMSTMYLGAYREHDWRRHLQLALEGLAAD